MSVHPSMEPTVGTPSGTVYNHDDFTVNDSERGTSEGTKDATLHPFCPASENESRSPCPALNALANHGFLPHDGKNLTIAQIARATQHVYNLSAPLAWLLAVAGVLYCGRFHFALALDPRKAHVGWRMDLHDLARHGRIEHDGSLAHADALPGEPYAPWEVDGALLGAFMRDASGPAAEGELEGLSEGEATAEVEGRPSDETMVDTAPSTPTSPDAPPPATEPTSPPTATSAEPTSAAHFTYADLVHARVRRDRVLAHHLDKLHDEIARGELSMTLQVFGQPLSAPAAGSAAPEPPVTPGSTLTPHISSPRPVSKRFSIRKSTISASSASPLPAPTSTSKPKSRLFPARTSSNPPPPDPMTLAAPRPWLSAWFGEDRLPYDDGWRTPARKIQLLGTARLSRSFLASVKAAEAQGTGASAPGADTEKSGNEAAKLGGERKVASSRQKGKGKGKKGDDEKGGRRISWPVSLHSRARSVSKSSRGMGEKV